MNDLQIFIDFADLGVKIIALMIGATWAIYKINEYREFKNWIQLDLDANVFKLARPEETRARTWNKQGDPIDLALTKHTHAVEILLRFANKGKTRVRIFNIQAAINTMRPPDQAEFDEGDGHLHLTRIHTSGNLVPIFQVAGKPDEEASFYYIEPGVEQIISHLCLVSEPRELLQVFAMFSLEQRRLFPKRMRDPQGLYPHTVARTFQVMADPQMHTKGTAI
jgi:hypothetical protein